MKKLLNLAILAVLLYIIFGIAMNSVNKHKATNAQKQPETTHNNPTDTEKNKQ